MNKKKTAWKFFGGIIVIAVIVVGGFFIWKSNAASQTASVYNLQTKSLATATQPTTTASTLNPTTGTTPTPANGGFPVIHVPPVTGGTLSPNPNIFSHLCSSTTTPSITVTSPNGGEVYAAGYSNPITWTDCNVPTNATVTASLIYAPTGAVINSSIATASAGAGSVGTIGGIAVQWPQTLPTGESFGDNFKIKLSTTYTTTYVVSGHVYTTSNTVSDESDNTFTIANELISPNGTPSSTVSGNTATFTIPFSVTAQGAPIYIKSGAAQSNDISVAGGTQLNCGSNFTNTATSFCIFGSYPDNSYTAVENTTGTVLQTTGNATMTANNNYKIPAGQTSSFVLTITANALPADGVYTAFLSWVPWSFIDSTTLSTGWGNPQGGFIIGYGTNPNSSFMATAALQ